MPQIWPATLNNPMNSFQRDQLDVSARTGDQFGVKTTRRRMTSAPGLLTLSFVMTLQQKITLDSFFNVTCNAGSHWFTADWLAHALSPDHQARIADYQAKSAGKNTTGLLFTVDMQCDIRDKGEIIDGYLHPFYDKNGG